jgi:hypothetical protein
MDFFTRWSGSNACRVLCINTPPEVCRAMRTFLIPTPTPTPTPTPSFEFRDPFAMLRPLLDEVIKSCDANTWSVTREVRKVEKVCNTVPSNIAGSYLRVR